MRHNFHTKYSPRCLMKHDKLAARAATCEITHVGHNHYIYLEIHHTLLTNSYHKSCSSDLCNYDTHQLLSLLYNSDTKHFIENVIPELHLRKWLFFFLLIVVLYENIIWNSIQADLITWYQSRNSVFLIFTYVAVPQCLWFWAQKREGRYDAFSHLSVFLLILFGKRGVPLTSPQFLYPN